MNFAQTFFQSVLGASANYIAFTMFLYLFPWLVLFLYFWRKVWQFDFHISSWYGVYRDQDTVEKLLISTNTVSSLVLHVKTGPAVGSWTFRFSVPQECVLVDVHRSNSWKKTFSSKEGVTCISSMRNNHTFPLKFDLQARAFSSSVIQCEVKLEFTSNTHKTGFPSNTNECKCLQTKKCVDFPAHMVPP